LQATLLMLLHSVRSFGEVVQPSGTLGLLGPVKPSDAVLAQVIDASGVRLQAEARDVLLHWQKRREYDGTRVRLPHVEAPPEGSSTAAAFKRGRAADMAMLEGFNLLDELLADYLVGFELRDQLPPKEVLLALDAAPLQRALTAAAARLAASFDAAPAHWLSVIAHDPVPESMSWRFDLRGGYILENRMQPMMRGDASQAYAQLLPELSNRSSRLGFQRKYAVRIRKAPL